MIIPEANADNIMKCAQAIFLGFNTRELVGGYIFAEKYDDLHHARKDIIQKAVDAGLALQIIEERGSQLALDASIRITSWDSKNKQLVFREHLQDFDPYIFFHSLIDMGDSSDIAVRRTSILREFSKKLEGERNILAKWGLYAETLVMQNGKVQVNPNIKSKSIVPTSPTLDNLIQSLDSEIAARTFILQFLGKNAHDFIGKDIQKDIMLAMTQAESEPEKSVQNIGRALEDHLKLIADVRSVQLINNRGNPINSIGPIISALRGRRIIAKYQRNILSGLEVFTSMDLFLGLAAWRNMPSHGRDLEANMRWSLSTEVAIVGIFQLLLSIRSTYYYVVENQTSY
ncbi:MAG: hypothetical protein ACTSUO_06270 [Candidatus Thorarchaeota archaeon]